MNFDYSDEQTSLKREARRFLEARCPGAAVHELSNDGDRSYDRALWTGIAELGWLGAAIPESYGGSGIGYIELCAIAEELGRVLAPVPVASTLYFFVEALLRGGSPAQRSHWLPRAAAGRVIGCLATSEGPGGIGARPLAASVEGGRLTGVKIPVTDGDVADAAIVLAAEAGGPGLYIVELEQSTVKRERLASLDATRGIARLSFSAAPAERLGAPGEGRRLLEEVNYRAAVLLAFEQLGGADRCLEAARDYALQRYAFGRQVGANQAIKHRLADMYVKNELARSTAYYAAWALNTNAAELPVAAATARLAASDAFNFASRENIQIHGGMGFTREADAHLYFRRARQLSLVAGSLASWGESLVCALSRRFPRTEHSTAAEV